MSTPRIPISAAKRIADEYGQNQVVIVTFDKSTSATHVVTYGKSTEECAQAAQGGNLVKRALGWPESLCHAKPKRSKFCAVCRQKFDRLSISRTTIHDKTSTNYDHDFEALERTQ